MKYEKSRKGSEPLRPESVVDGEEILVGRRHPGDIPTLNRAWLAWFEAKVCVVTGAVQGIGARTAERLAGEGATVALGISMLEAWRRRPARSAQREVGPSLSFATSRILQQSRLP